MITEKRLEELIEQKAVIYDIFSGECIERNLMYLAIYGSGHLLFNDNLEFPSTYLAFLFETKEDAEFALRYKNITRTETLSLPSWEEFECETFMGVDGNRYNLLKIFDNTTIWLTIGNNEKVCADFRATKEDYVKACELCRELFLGEAE